ncbi:hypothetical protein CZ774_12070 [Frigoribacterium sp. JB110]|nr:hypothetical protein CZ774_12070 [Frigoribacterium sp. JB110]
MAARSPETDSTSVPERQGRMRRSLRETEVRRPTRAGEGEFESA